MMFSLILAAAAAQATPAPAAVQAETAKIEQSLAKWRGGAAKRDGKFGCATKQSTGDLELDALRCASVVKCFAPIAPKLDALEKDNTLGDDERKTKMTALAESTKPCLAATTRKAVAALATVRAGG